MSRQSEVVRYVKVSYFRNRSLETVLTLLLASILDLCDSNIHFWLGLDSHVEIWPMNDGKELAFVRCQAFVSSG